MGDPVPCSLAAALSDRAVVVDGGLGTLLADRGADVAAPLWSARTLLEPPDAILDVHRDYFAAGAEVAVTVLVPGLGVRLRTSRAHGRSRRGEMLAAQRRARQAGP